MIVTFYDEYTDIEEILIEIKVLIEGCDKPQNKNLLMLGLSMLDATISDFISVANSQFSRFKLNINKFQTGKMSVYDLLREVLVLFDKFEPLDSGAGKFSSEPAIVHKMLAITSQGIKFNLMLNGGYSDFGEEPSSRGPIFIHSLQNKTGAAYLKRIPQILPVLIRIFKLTPGRIQVHETIIDIFNSVSGFSLHLYKDKYTQIKVVDSYRQIYSFVIDVLQDQQNRSMTMQHLAYEFSNLIGNLFNESILVDMEKMDEIELLVRLVFDVTSEIFSKKHVCDYVVFMNLLRFWGKVGLFSKRSMIMAAYRGQTTRILKLSIEYLFLVLRHIDYETPEESSEILQKICKSIYMAYHQDLQELLGICLEMLSRIRETHQANPERELDAIYFFSLYLSLTENLSPKLVDHSQTYTFNQTLTKIHAQLTSQTLDYLWNCITWLKDNNSPAVNIVRIFFIKTLSSLLVDWMLNDKWDFTCWLTDVCEFVNDNARSFEEKKTDIIVFVIRLLSTREMINRVSFGYFVSYLTEICSI